MPHLILTSVINTINIPKFIDNTICDIHKIPFLTEKLEALQKKIIRFPMFGFLSKTANKKFEFEIENSFLCDQNKTYSPTKGC